MENNNNLFSDTTNYEVSYLLWVLLWVNAIQDAYLWIDSPDCFFFKTDFIHWNHDINSTLRKADWFHRVLATITDVKNIVWNRMDFFKETIERLLSFEENKITFFTTMPMAQLVWYDYEWLVNAVKSKYNKSTYFINSRSMSWCWLDWYSDLLNSLAKNIPLNWKKIKKNTVWIVWNLFDRNEWDCIWNIDQLKNIFEQFWLKVESIWLDWWKYCDIEKIKNAWTIVSLPYWRKAWKNLAKRLWVPLLELDIPFWITNCINFVEQIAKFFNKENDLEKILYFLMKKDTNISIIKWTIKHTFWNKKILFCADPYLIPWIIDICETLWIEINQIFIHWYKEFLKNNLNKNYEKYEQIIYWINDIQAQTDWVDLMISNTQTSWFIHFKKADKNPELLKFMEFWFPSYNYHCYTKNPYIWFIWTLNFINRMANQLNHYKNER